VEGSKAVRYQPTAVERAKLFKSLKIDLIISPFIIPKYQVTQIYLILLLFSRSLSYIIYFPINNSIPYLHFNFLLLSAATHTRSHTHAHIFCCSKTILAWKSIIRKLAFTCNCYQLSRPSAFAWYAQHRPLFFLLLYRSRSKSTHTCSLALGQRRGRVTHACK
jgi:hypothetical protein